LYSQSLISFYDSFVTNWLVDDLTFTNVVMFTQDGDDSVSSSPKLISPDGSMIKNSYEDAFFYIHYKKVAAKGASFSNLKFESVVCYGCVDSLIYFSAETLNIDSFTITSIKGYDALGNGIPHCDVSRRYDRNPRPLARNLHPRKVHSYSKDHKPLWDQRIHC